MSKSYTSAINARAARPRSKRLRELGYSGNMSSSGIGQVVEQLSQEQIEGLNNLLNWFGFDGDNHAIYVKKDEDDNPRNFYAFGNVAAGGIGSGGGGGTYTVLTYDQSLLLTQEAMGQIPTAFSVKKLGDRITALENAPGGGVTSFNGRTGAVTLQQTDVNPFLPASLPNPFALTFGSKTYNGAAAVSIVANDIYAVLGYTPYNASNPAGYITASALNGYATESWVGANYQPTIPANTYHPYGGDGSVALTASILSLSGIYDFSWKGSFSKSKDRLGLSYYSAASTTTYFFIHDESGNVGIGTTNPSQKLHVEGNVLAWGQVTAGTASDARLKDNVRKITDASRVLMSIGGVEFDWNAEATRNCSTLKGHDVGCIAQEVEVVIPSAVSPVFGKYKRLDYNKITPYLVEGWKTHERRIAELENELRMLKSRMI